METAKAEAHSRRKHTIEAKWKYRPMNETFATFDHPVPGWRGEPVEAWRTQSWMDMSAELAREGGAYRDWIGPFVDLDHGLLNSPAWREFWLYLIDKQAVPRQWMRWAHSFAQRFRKVTPGSPADTQLYTYFPDTDIVITADKALLAILEECRPYAPCPLPSGYFVPAGARGVEDALQLVGSNS